MIGPESSLTDIAFEVCTSLHQHGCTAVLTGGSAATFYAPESYQSKDLDFVIDFWSSLPKESVLEGLGFFREGATYHHPRSVYTLDFPAGPLAVGEEVLTEWNTVWRANKLLHVLTPTDCVRDRLAWFLFARRPDYSALEQAVAVANAVEFDGELVKRWCQVEGGTERYDLFAARIRPREA